MKLYDSTETIQIGDLSDNIIECIVEEERNGLFELTLTYPASYDYSLDLIKENIIVANANNILLNQKFRIYNIRKKYSNMIEVCARHISYDLLDDFIENINIENQSCEYALNQIFKNSQFSKNYKGYSDIINSQNYKSNMSNCLNAIVGQRGSIVDTFGSGAEILRENENIYILNKRGHDNGVSITYGDNMSAFTCEEDTTDLITRIYPYIKNSEDGKEIIITLPERFVNSPIVAKYSHPYIKSIDFSDKFEQGEKFNLAKLKLEAEKYFIQNKCDIPKMTFNVDFVLIEKYNLSLCDIVTINHKVYNIITQSKVIKASFDVIKNRYKKMTLGDSKATLGNLIGGSSSIGPPGKDGIQGAPGKDGEEFPDVLPEIPVLHADLKGFSSVDLTWIFENKVYYSYQLFASKIDSNPNAFDLIFEGQGSSFLHQVKPGEVWFYWVRALNTHGKATELSNKLIITTKKEDDFENYFSSLAVKDLVVNMFSVDYMSAGIIKAHWIDAKNLSVTDGNGKRTLDIDSFGNVNLNVNSLSIKSKDISNVLEANSTKINEIEQKTTSTAIINTVSQTIDNKVKVVDKKLAEMKLENDVLNIKFEQRGGVNYLRCADGFKNNITADWHTRTFNNNLGAVLSIINNEWAYPDPNIATFQLSVLDNWSISSGEIATIQYDIKVQKGKEYTISFYTAGHRHSDCYSQIRGQENNGNAVIAAIGFSPQRGGSNLNNWSIVQYSFVAQANFVHFEIGMRNRGDADPYLWFSKPILNDGALPIQFTTNDKELHSGITKINKDGIRCDFEDNTYASMGNDGFKFFKKGMSRAYQYITFNAKVSKIRNGYWTRVQFPEFFRGKQINVDFQLFVMLGAFNLDAYVNGSTRGALRVQFAEWGDWQAHDCALQVRPCMQKLGLDTGLKYGWDSATTDQGATANEGEADVIIFAQM